MANKNNVLNVLDLFSGCGGLSLGFEMSGFNIKYAIDNDKNAIGTYKLNHKNTCTLLYDLSKLDKEILKKLSHDNIDLIIGGPPCQGISLAGPRKLSDPRNKLFKTFIDVVKYLKPKAFVLENVPGLFGLFKGHFKELLLNEFKNIGYQVSYTILNSADYGVPQTRRRVFFVGLQKHNSFSFPKPTHSNDISLFEILNQYVTCEQALSDLPSLEKMAENNIIVYSSSPQNEYQFLMRKNSSRVYNHDVTIHKRHVKEIISLVPEGGNYKDLPKKYQTSRNYHIAWTRYHSLKPAPTIDTGHRHHFHYKYNRVPTVRENARLQSFPDNFIFTGNKTEQYMQVGNAVPPLLAFALAKQLKKYI